MEAMITEIAKRCGAVAVFDGREVWATVTGPLIKKLMIAAAKAEREACAKVCDDLREDGDGETLCEGYCAAAIRMRSNDHIAAAEEKQLRLDASRYRWLRDSKNAYPLFFIAQRDPNNVVVQFTGELADMNIDEMMKTPNV